jgi:hypothetical protein
MTSHDTEPGRPPASPATETIAAASEGEADTEGHSMLTLELGRTIERDRVRDVEQANRQHARTHELDAKREGGLFRRFRRR